MNTLEKVINHVKDGYLWFSEKVSEHPHIFIWAALLYVAVRR